MRVNRNNLLKVSIVIPASLVLVLFLIIDIANAATTASVAATVTAQNISVAVTDGTVAYGTLGLSANQDTALTGLNDSQTATNNGNITENFNILGQNSTSWTLAGTIGAETYTHKWCTTDCDGTPTWSALTTSYQTLSTAVAVSGTTVFDLQIGTPSSTADYTQQTVSVTVQAVAN